jgi:2-polyprenyl-6-methoxyphenol hydroxylase-like FAD-dependent oxidoreductase
MMWIFLAIFAVLCIAVYATLKHYDQFRLESSKLGEENPQKPLNQVVIIGAGAAGLATAEAVSRHAAKVLVIERSKKPEQGASIVPQGSHTHNLLDRGLRIADHLFPGLLKEVVSRGATTRDVSALKWYVAKGWTHPMNPGEIYPTHLSTHRGLFESVMRDRIAKNNKITILYSHEFVEFEVHPSNSKHIIGVRYTNKEDSSSHTITSDLVIDCSGMLSPVPKVLAKLGIEIEKTKVVSNLQYNTMRVKTPPNTTNYYYQNIPPERWYGGVLWHIAPEEAFLTLIAFNKSSTQKIPSEKSEFLEFVKKMPELQEIAQKCEPLTDVSVYNKEGNQYIYYENTDLHGFIALGDSVCNFNPVYGQGVTAAFESILSLDTLLRKEPFKQGFCKLFQKEVARVTTVPWMLATLSDLRFSQTTTNSKALKMLAPVSDKLMQKWLRAATDYKVAAAAFLKIVMQEDGFVWWFINPSLILAILRG